MLKRILALDLDPVDRLILRKVLENDFEIIGVHSEQQAIAFATATTFDIAVINIKIINHFDSIAVLSRLRKIHPSFVAIATTPLLYNELESTLIKSGFNGVALKPLTPTRIKSIIVDAFSVKSLAPSAEFS
jgi:DNA-binding NarL/FixJ family response regulator